jgi:hypothetical protein
MTAALMNASAKTPGGSRRITHELGRHDSAKTHERALQRPLLHRARYEVDTALASAHTGAAVRGMKLLFEGARVVRWPT